MRKFLVFAAIFLFSVSAFSFTAQDVKIFTLENGLKIYFLEDSSSPTVRIELCVNAGFTFQNHKNAGFFTLYSRLTDGKLSNDSVRFVKKVAPSAAEKAILELSEKLKPIRPADSTLNAVLSAMNLEGAEYASSAAGFINSAIDAKVFAKNPWSRESGVNIGEFKAKTKEEVRTILQNIAETYYIPSNSALFVSGNISENACVSLVKKYFSSFTAKEFAGSAFEISLAPSNQRKFVLAHKDFSDEMSQIVLQYKNLSSDEADCLASTWNKDGSGFKKLLLKQRNLKILGDEYIDVSSAKEKSSTRVIIQSLLGNAKVSPVVQTNLFLEMSRDEDVFSEKEMQKSLKNEKTEFTRLSESSELMMAKISNYIFSKNADSDSIQQFFEKNERLSQIKMKNLQEKIASEQPFVFVLVNDKIYQKYAAEFKKAGFEQILQKNAAWYNQDFYKTALKTEAKTPETNTNLLEDIASSSERFISKNLAEFSSFTLKNGIPVTVKQSESSSTSVISLTIAGGELLFCDKVPGLASVLTNSIAVNINRQLDLFAANGAVTGFYEVGSQTLSTHSIITVTCLSKEIDFALQAAYSALVYCDISPATADGVTYDERTQWRLKTGSTEFQLLCEAVRILYAGMEYPKLYKDTQDKPAENLDFTKILENYPILLDSTRFSLILSGGIKENEKLLKTLNATFGLLGSIEQNRSIDLRVQKPDFAKLASSEKRIALRHLFLTDISKDKAGPMPAVLIPTTKFLDPLLYCFPTPDLNSTDIALFDALLIEIANRMQCELAKKYPETKVKALLSENDLPFARIFVTNIEHTAEVDALFTKTVQSLKNDISLQMQIKTEQVIDLEKNELFSSLENNWLMAVISGAGSQEGTARLMQSGEVQKNPKLYLEQYQAISKAKTEDYFLIAESYFSEKPPLRIYSKDSKK